ncbi:MAG TPA: LacI family DNA-binding transcriptional regulator, partial [Verrucomicrobiae bacterium]|nr:LacI family DNA-binding transcriptional regulator [Verrucomicrobiae bacterium]
MARLPGGRERKRITIRDVAARAGVDASLVSRVLNDHPKASAGPATRERILEAARSLGYQPNLAARSLRMARTWTLGLMLPNLTNPLYAAIARAAEGRAQERGFGLVFGTHVEGEAEATFTRLLQQGRVDGLLTASGVLGDAFIRRFANGEQGPVVMLNRRVRGVRAAVTVDDAAGAALAVRHLAELGHTQIAGIFGPG